MTGRHSRAQDPVLPGMAEPATAPIRTAPTEAAPARAAEVTGTRSELSRSDAARSDAARSDTARSDTARADTARADTARSDTAQADAARADAAQADAAQADKGEPAAPTILEQLGGIPGMIYSTVPVVLFVIVNSLASLQPALIAAVGVAVAIAIWRLVRKEPLQPAVSGLFGVGIGALIAHHTGQARDFFLLGIWYSGVLAVVFLASVLVRWPLAGVIWHGINGDGQGWRGDRSLRRAYTLATLLWGVMFAVKFVAQRWLYDANEPGWLAFARIAGYALTALALLGTFWAVRRARSGSDEAQPA